MSNNKASGAKGEDAISDKLAKALEWAIKEIDRNTCQHEETYRGGSIWTICSGCGKQWADDRGGFEPYREPKQLGEARAALAAAKDKK